MCPCWDKPMTNQYEPSTSWNLPFPRDALLQLWDLLAVVADTTGNHASRAVMRAAGCGLRDWCGAVCRTHSWFPWTAQVKIRALAKKRLLIKGKLKQRCLHSRRSAKLFNRLTKVSKESHWSNWASVAVCATNLWVPSSWRPSPPWFESSSGLSLMPSSTFSKSSISSPCSRSSLLALHVITKGRQLVLSTFHESSLC